MDKAIETKSNRLSPEVRREQLIEAAIETIAEHGLSRLTLSKVAERAGLTPGMVNFHFTSKQALLTATLEHVARTFEDACEEAIAQAGGDASNALVGLIAASFSNETCEPGRVALWYAFWSESQTREDYMEICGRSDRAFYDAIYSLIDQLSTSDGREVNVRAATLGLSGIVDSLWQEFLTATGKFDRKEAVATCQGYLQNLLPSFSPSRSAPALQAVETPEDEGLPHTLPAWTYCSEDFFRKEMARIFKPAWQLVCHINDVPHPGDFFTFNGLGERAFVMRGEDGVLRAFHNVCPHRAHAVLRGESGNCPGMIRCPYHSWGFSHEGDLKAIAAAKTFPPFDNGNFGLRPLELEVFMGLIFIRFASEGPSVAERYAPYTDELAPHKFEELVPIAPMYDEKLNADWKNVWDNYLEDYHFPTGHPGLFGLMTPDYAREPDEATRTIRLSHEMRDKPKGSWSVNNYAKLLPELEHLPRSLRRRWSYYFMYPAVSLDVYPDVMDFFHVVPTGPGKCRLRVGTYGTANASRELQASRYLAGRIGWQVHNEDVELIESVQQGLASSAYNTGLLGEKEVATFAFQRWAAEDMPESAMKSIP